MMASEGGVDTQMENELFKVGSMSGIDGNVSDEANLSDGVELVIDQSGTSIPGTSKIAAPDPGTSKLGTSNPGASGSVSGAASGGLISQPVNIEQPKQQPILEQPIQHIQSTQQQQQHSVQYVMTNGDTNGYYLSTNQPAYITAPGNPHIQMNSNNINSNNSENYINSPLFEKAVYDENMQPWLRDEDNYYFTCYSSEAFVLAQKRQNGLNINKKKMKSLDAQIGISVYHRKDSQRLIIKKRQHIGLFQISKKSPSLRSGMSAIIVGILGVIYGAIMSTTTVAAIIGGFLIVIGFVLIFACHSKSTSTSSVKKFEFTVQSIPLNSIHYVDRELETFNAKSSGCCGGCCGCCGCCDDKLDEIEYSEITIGYNRSNVSSSFGILTGWTTNTEDTVKLKLFSNHSYSLQQYLNSILDGDNPMSYNTEYSRYINYNLLPTK